MRQVVIFLTLSLEANEISVKPEIKGMFLLAGLLSSLRCTG